MENLDLEENNKLIENKLSKFNCLKITRTPSFTFVLTKILLIFTLGISILLLFIPWVQNSYGTGQIISLSPNKRTQNISALVSGRIKNWYVQEGQQVKKGDKIVEIVDNDSELISRLQANIDNIKTKLEATKIAKENTFSALQRQKNLNEIGLSSDKDVEQVTIRYKDFVVKLAEIKNKLNTAEKELSRQQRQIIYAPANGSVIRIFTGDTATAVKVGDNIASFVPNEIDFAVEIFISGVDAPLVYKGRKVRMQFEGWPIIQFSGWPSTAIGTFGGIVKSVDPTVSPNGKFRVIIIPDKNDNPWPNQKYLRYGSKVKGWVLLDEVSIGYEIWRKINNFPPENSQNKNNLSHSF